MTCNIPEWDFWIMSGFIFPPTSRPNIDRLDSVGAVHVGMAGCCEWIVEPAVTALTVRDGTARREDTGGSAIDVAHSGGTLPGEACPPVVERDSLEKAGAVPSGVVKQRLRRERENVTCHESCHPNVALEGNVEVLPLVVLCHGNPENVVDGHGLPLPVQ